MKIGELFVRLGVQADTFTVKDFASAVGQIPLSVGAAVASLAGMSIGFMDLTKHTLDLSNNLSMFRAETGLSVEELGRWQAVAKQVGMSGDVVTQSIMGITNALAQIRLGNGAAMLPFGRLGVDIRGKTPFELLKDVLANRSGLSNDVRRQLMGQIGIAPEMLRIGELSSGQFSRMASVGPTMREQDIRAMQDLQASLARFSITVEKSFIPVLEKFEPIMGELTEALTFIIQKMGDFAVTELGSSAKIVNTMRKQGVINTLDTVLNGLVPPSAEEIRGGRLAVSNVNVTQNIHSTADPEEVARMAHEHFTREKTKAAKHFDNGGY